MNVERHFAVVGLLEEREATARAVEKVLPAHFRGTVKEMMAREQEFMSEDVIACFKFSYLYSVQWLDLIL